MGYTNYYTVTAPNTKNAMLGNRKHIQLLEKILEDGIERGLLAGWDGEKKAKCVGDLLTIEDSGAFKLVFNGVAADRGAYETFSVSSSTERSQFCKTFHFPYNAYVVACLMVLADAGILTWSSDGSLIDNHEALNVLDRAIKAVRASDEHVE